MKKRIFYKLAMHVRKVFIYKRNAPKRRRGPAAVHELFGTRSPSTNSCESRDFPRTKHRPNRNKASSPNKRRGPCPRNPKPHPGHGTRSRDTVKVTTV